MSPVDTVWSEHQTTPDAIEEALRTLLLERYAERDGIAPARVLNMLAFVEHAWSGEVANRLRGVGRYHASRVIVLSFDPARQRLDARATIASEDPNPGEVSLLRETVVVEIGQRHLDDLTTIAAPLVVRDLPTMLWSPHGHFEATDALLPLAQTILIDSVDEPDPHVAIQRAQDLAQRVHVVDLAWLRCTQWREQIAAAFDPSPMRRQLPTIASVEIEHHPDSTIVAMLLTGWLCSRLGWRPGALVAHAGVLAGTARARRQEVAINLREDRTLQERGLSEVTLRTAAGTTVSFMQTPSGLRTRRSAPYAPDREWAILGAPRSEGRILGEGIRQAVLEDPAYAPALSATAAEAAP